MRGVVSAMLGRAPDDARSLAEGRTLAGLIAPDVLRQLPRPVPVVGAERVVAALRSTAEPDFVRTLRAEHSTGWRNGPGGQLLPPPGVELRVEIGGELFTPGEVLAAADAADREAADGWRVYERIWQVNEAGELVEVDRSEIAPRWVLHDQHGPRWLCGFGAGALHDLAAAPALKFVAVREGATG